MEWPMYNTVQFSVCSLILGFIFYRPDVRSDQLEVQISQILSIINDLSQKIQ